jgi:hypothetical protein
MRCRKTVTDKKLAANRQNAKSSTGPRTARGRYQASLNALTSGLCSKRGYIPGIDGHPEEVQQLEAGLRREYEPHGTEEGIHFEEMFKAALRLRRATRYESASIRDAAYYNRAQPPPSDDLWSACGTTLDLLEAAQQEVRNTKHISPATYEKVLPLMTWANRRAGYPEALGEEGIAPREQEFDLSLFSADLKQQILVTTAQLNFFQERHSEQEDDYYGKLSLPSASVMNNTFRYENEALNRFERARNSLLECQERRLKKNDA